MHPILVLNLLSAAECEEIIALASRQGWTAAQCGGSVEDHVAAMSTYVPIVAGTEWIAARLRIALARSNDHFRLDVFDGGDLREDCTIFRYVERDYFEWHSDNDVTAAGERKLAITVQLSEPTTYEGGDLEFLPGGPVQMSRARGAAVVFPAFRCHRVSRLTRGFRYSLAAGLFGPPLR